MDINLIDPTRENIDILNPKDLNILKSILKKEPEERAMNELSFLDKALEKIPFFSEQIQTQDEEIKLEVLRELRLEEYPKGKAVFHAGEIGKYFYMIIKGSVYAMRRKDKASNQKQKQRFSKQGDRTPDLSPLVRKIQRTDPEGFDFTMIKSSFIPLSEEDMEALYPDHILLNTMKAPSYFGEVALSNKSVRSATIFTREPTCLALLKGAVYGQILAAAREKKVKQQIEFLKSTSLMGSLGVNTLGTILLFLSAETLPRNSVIFRQGDRANFVYFIKEGEVELIKETDFCPVEEEAFLQADTGNMLAKTASKKRAAKNKHMFLQKKKMRIAILGPSQVLGDLEFIQNLSFNQHTAVCASQEKLLGNIPHPSTFLSQFRATYSKTDWRGLFEDKVYTFNKESASKPDTAKHSFFMGKLQENKSTVNALPMETNYGLAEQHSFIEKNGPGVEGFSNTSSPHHSRFKSLGSQAQFSARSPSQRNSAFDQIIEASPPPVKRGRDFINPPKKDSSRRNSLRHSSSRHEESVLFKVMDAMKNQMSEVVQEQRRKMLHEKLTECMGEADLINQHLSLSIISPPVTRSLVPLSTSPSSRFVGIAKTNHRLELGDRSSREKIKFDATTANGFYPVSPNLRNSVSPRDQLERLDHEILVTPKKMESLAKEKIVFSSLRKVQTTSKKPSDVSNQLPDIQSGRTKLSVEKVIDAASPKVLVRGKSSSVHDLFSYHYCKPQELERAIAQKPLTKNSKTPRELSLKNDTPKSVRNTKKPELERVILNGTSLSFGSGKKFLAKPSTAI